MKRESSDHIRVTVTGLIKKQNPRLELPEREKLLLRLPRDISVQAFIAAKGNEFKGLKRSFPLKARLGQTCSMQSKCKSIKAKASCGISTRSSIGGTVIMLQLLLAVRRDFLLLAFREVHHWLCLLTSVFHCPLSHADSLVFDNGSFSVQFMKTLRVPDDVCDWFSFLS